MDRKTEKNNVYLTNDFSKFTQPKQSDDFYGWVNYDWLLSNKIPKDEIRYTHFIQTQHKINSQLKKILEKNIYPLGTTLYESYLNTQYKNKYSISELKDLLKIVDKIQTADDLVPVATRLLFIGVSTLFNISVDANLFSSCNNITYITQPSLGLPDRSYYNNSKYANIKQKY
jgi:predicted metalloendopeptidase